MIDGGNCGISDSWRAGRIAEKGGRTQPWERRGAEADDLRCTICDVRFFDLKPASVVNRKSQVANHQSQISPSPTPRQTSWHRATALTHGVRFYPTVCNALSSLLGDRLSPNNQASDGSTEGRGHGFPVARLPGGHATLVLTDPSDGSPNTMSVIVAVGGRTNSVTVLSVAVLLWPLQRFGPPTYPISVDNRYQTWARKPDVA